MAPVYSIMTATLLALPVALAQSCANLSPKYTPQMASGYSAKVILNNLKTPRGLTFDSAGNLLVVESGGAGVRYIKLQDNGSSACVASSKSLISDNTLNHGIALSGDGKTLFVSSLSNVYAYPYDAAAGTVGTRKVVINNMSASDHSTRTLLIPKSNPDVLLVSRGSNANIDSATTDVNSGRSQIRIFNIANITATAVDYSKAGEILGWGLRNSVGVAEDPSTGGIWSVENSVDDLQRNGKDVHQTNPAEELNYHGLINATTKPAERGLNFGYPTCITAWDPSVLPNNANIKVGTQFLYGNPSGSNTDSLCATQRQAPRLSFPAHTAPLDIKFRNDASAAYIAFHGSWDKNPPDGYRVSRVDFSGGQPKEPPTSTTAAVNIMTNSNNGACPGSCFRPVGLAVDSKGRLYVTSDSTNELFVITGA